MVVFNVFKPYTSGFQIPSRPLVIGPLFFLWTNQDDTEVAHIANVIRAKTIL